MEKNYVVGVDIGGQTSKCGVVDKNGNVLAQTVIRSDNHDVVEPYIAELAEALKKIMLALKVRFVESVSELRMQTTIPEPSRTL